MAEKLSESEQREVVQRFKGLRTELEALYRKLGEVDGDRSEHELVVKQLGMLGSERRCWHQVGNVLAEKTVGEVMPTIQSNKEQLTKVITALTEKIEASEKELHTLQTKYNIREATFPRQLNPQ